MSAERKYERYLCKFEGVYWCHMPNIYLALRDWVTQKRASETTWFCRFYELWTFYVWMHGRSEYRDAPTKQTVLDYYAFLREKGLRQTSIRSTHIRLKSFFSWLADEELYSDIFNGLEVSAGTYRKKPVLSAHEVKSLLDGLTNIKARAMVHLMVFCGLRCIEVAELCWGDIDADRAIVRGKGREDKSELIVLPVSVQTALRDWRYHTPGSTAGDAPVFVGDVLIHQPMASKSVSAFVNAHLSARFPEKQGLTAHSLRHTAVTLAIESGLDISRVSRFARHKSVVTTMLYIHDIHRFSDPPEARIETLVSNATPNNDLTPDKLQSAIKAALIGLFKG